MFILFVPLVTKTTVKFLILLRSASIYLTRALRFKAIDCFSKWCIFN